MPLRGIGGMKNSWTKRVKTGGKMNPVSTLPTSLKGQGQVQPLLYTLTDKFSSRGSFQLILGINFRD